MINIIKTGSTIMVGLTNCIANTIARLFILKSSDDSDADRTWQPPVLNTNTKDFEGEDEEDVYNEFEQEYSNMKDDPDTNIQFVQTVQMFPCLYDHTTKDYSNRCAQDKAWGEIGKKFDANMNECKERWKNLRACFTRHLKAKPPSGSAAKFKKPYYLAEFLNFLELFTKSRKQSVSLSSNEYSEHNENVGNVCEIEEDQTDNNLIEDNFADSSFIEPTPQQWTSSTLSSSFQKKKLPVELEDVNKAALNSFSKKNQIILKIWIYVFLKVYYQTCDL
ncbi:hypothetical protein QTP88_023694 [Uroleucon formosanum]